MSSIRRLNKHFTTKSRNGTPALVRQAQKTCQRRKAFLPSPPDPILSSPSPKSILSRPSLKPTPPPRTPCLKRRSNLARGAATAETRIETLRVWPPVPSFRTRVPPPELASRAAFLPDRRNLPVLNPTPPRLSLQLWLLLLRVLVSRPSPD